ncbi:LytTR family DNA-binding domain-containing protein [Novosphingobium sp. PS1R-30]|uniref:LytTR family DNA-binding domain-containing protein n=1 Tax=Novosphingobium anseongense TaxID=3133436 RepID=A0ABU8S2X3_9SPHN
MNWLRGALLEAWGMAVFAVIVGFLGPFGSYTGNTLVYRVQTWGGLLLGAYVFVRPLIWGSDHLARRTDLPREALAFWSAAAMSVPLAMVWRAVGQDAFRALNGYAVLVPFALLCALAVLGVTRWAHSTSRRLQIRSAGAAVPALPEEPQPEIDGNADIKNADGAPKLMARLGSAFRFPIVALQSEDHYVRVHGANGSELLLMRLRDAIAEMDGIPGEQVHRSWWVARDGVEGLAKSGRGWTIRLINGQLAPVARESVDRLRRSGFLRELTDGSI